MSKSHNSLIAPLPPSFDEINTELSFTLSTAS